MNIDHLSSFVILGGSKSHAPFIRAAQKLGYCVVVIDQNTSSPGAALADRFYPISIHDIEAISEVCNKLNKDKTLKGILTYSSHSKPLLAVAMLCRRFQLPSFSIESADYAIDKKEMKRRFSQCGVPSPSYVVTDSFNEDM